MFRIFSLILLLTSLIILLSGCATFNRGELFGCYRIKGNDRLIAYIKNCDAEKCRLVDIYISSMGMVPKEVIPSFILIKKLDKQVTCPIIINETEVDKARRRISE